jgi:3-methyladenine DNA glycosylase AlkD
MVRAWSTRKEEFVKRAAFALIAGMALHAKTAPDQPFVASLRLIERGAADPRNFVKKGVSWALRAVGKRSPDLRRRAIALSKRLAASPDPAARWVGRDALRDLSRNRPAAA